MAGDKTAGPSSGAGEGRTAIPRTRTRTGCQACRVRRIKCSEGRLVPSSDPGQPARRSPCAKCIKRRRQCRYPDGNDWYDAVDDGSEASTSKEALEEEEPLEDMAESDLYGAAIESQQVYPTQAMIPAVAPVQTLQERSRQLLTFPCLAIECPPSSPAPSSRPVSPSTLEAHLANLPELDLSIFDDPQPDNMLVPYQPQLAPQSRISLWDKNIADDSDHMLVSYLFAGKFEAVGVYGASDPSKDHFQFHNLPRIRYALAYHNQGETLEGDLVYHSALALSGFHQALFCSKALLDKSRQHVRQAHSTLQLIRSSDATRTETSLIGITLLALAQMFGGLQIQLEADDLSAEVSTPLGHEAYDVLCVYSVMIALARGTAPSHSPATAGTPNIEDIFGVARPTWNMLAKLATLLANVRQADPVAQLIGIGNHQEECRRLLQESTITLDRIERSSRDQRIKLGSRAMHHAALILAHVEILHTSRSDPVIQDACTAILIALLQIDPRERRVGVALPLTMASCYTNDPLQHMQFTELTQSTRVVKEVDAPRPTISALALTLASNSPETDCPVPWREAMQIASLSLLL